MARWRQEPATDNQKKWLAKRFLNAPRSFNIEEITKGDAANILTRLKHGAQVRLRFLLQLLLSLIQRCREDTNKRRNHLPKEVGRKNVNWLEQSGNE